MAVRGLSSAQRAFTVLEVIAANQPIGFTALCELVGEDKSAVQRVLVTLADVGWIRQTGEPRSRWELTERPLVVAGLAQRRSNLLSRLRPIMEELRDATGESVSLAVPMGDRIVIVYVAESRQLVRSAPHVGMVVPYDRSATAIGLYAHLTEAEIADYLGAPPTGALAAEIEAARERGWSVGAGTVDVGSASVAAAVLDAEGRPVGVLLFSAPADRLTGAAIDEAGQRIARAAATASLDRG